MQLKNYYYYFKGAIPKETCERIITMGLSGIQQAESKGDITEAYTFGHDEKGANPNAFPAGDLSKQQLKKLGVEKSYIRDSNISWLTDQWLYDLFHPYVQEANEAAGWYWQWDFAESFQFTSYKPGGFYGWHKDGPSDHPGKYKRYIYGVTGEPLTVRNQLPPGYAVEEGYIGKVRKISMTVNLNSPDDYDGGNLMFDFGHHTNGDQFYECEEIREQGSIIVFPSFLDHCVTPVTKGTRYSLVLWTLGNPWI